MDSRSKTYDLTILDSYSEMVARIAQKFPCGLQNDGIIKHIVCNVVKDRFIFSAQNSDFDGHADSLLLARPTGLLEYMRMNREFGSAADSLTDGRAIVTG